MEKFIADVILSMREYQKENNVRHQCVSNCLYLFDTMRMNLKSNDVKLKAFIVYSYDDETVVHCYTTGHVVVMLDDDIIEPSYDVFCKKNVVYCESIKEFFDMFNDNDKEILKSKLNIKQMVQDHVDFSKIAQQINSGARPDFDAVSLQHYHKQADYIESRVN